MSCRETTEPGFDFVQGIRQRVIAEDVACVRVIQGDELRVRSGNEGWRRAGTFGIASVRGR
jgi:hypothetical protein